MSFSLADERWLPKSVLCLRGYTLNKFLHDVSRAEFEHLIGRENICENVQEALKRAEKPLSVEVL